MTLTPALIDALQAKADRQAETLRDILAICENAEIYNSTTLAAMIRQRINRKDME